MSSKIEDIASVHLGKAGDGSVVKPYITPDFIDRSLLVGIPRVLNRTAYNIDESDLPFVGFDTWNCYEFSTLTDNGFPVCGVIRISYPSDSPNIVESKSLKLYMNSFNMTHCGKSISDAIMKAEEVIIQDLAPALGIDYEDLEVSFCDETSDEAKPIKGHFALLEQVVDVENLSFDHFNEDPNILEIVEYEGNVAGMQVRSAVLRSNCRVTNQPDWGDVYITYKGDRGVTNESLLQYIVSMRKENHFHEEICECIYKRLHDILKPEELLVACLYTRRGGIDINPVRATSYPTLMQYANNLGKTFVLNNKTLRQ
jgi:7-cyano-7-deazaguanine reductase